MNEQADEAALVSDSYIDTLLALHGRRLAPVAVAERLPPGEIRHAIDLLAGALPRLHPSFAFEEALAVRLRQAPSVPGPAHIAMLRPALAPAAGRRLDRRVVLGVGGAAIASGVSVAAVYAWRQAARRGRPAREVPV